MIRVITSSALESELYALNPKINNAVGSVGNMIEDLTADRHLDFDMLLTVVDPDNSDEFGLAFAGSTLSLEFSNERIAIVDFDVDTGDETVLETFEPQEVNKAATCLYNRLV